MNAKQVMQTGVAVVSPELSIHQFEEFLTSEEVSGAPVVDSEGALIGIASKTDVITAFAEKMDARSEFGASLTVQDVMTRDVICIDPETPITEVARIMLDGRVHRVIVSEDGAIVGIITPFDLLHVALERGALDRP